MLHYGFYTGKNSEGNRSYQDLEEDLIVLIRGQGGRLVATTQIESPFKEQTMKLYEIPSKGAINFLVSNKRDVEISNIKCNGLVTCLGFDESGECCKELDKKLRQLLNDYSVDRV